MGWSAQMATITGSFAYENTKTEVTTTVTDPNGNTTASTADEWGRTTWVKPPAGAWIEYQYDTAQSL